MKKISIINKLSLILTAFLLLLTLILAGASSAVVSYAETSSTVLYTPQPSEEDAQRYGLSDLDYKYFGGFSNRGNFSAYDGSVEDPNRIYPHGETSLYDYVMGQIDVLVGGSKNFEYYGTYNVAFKRYTRIYIDPVFLDTHYGILGAYTLKECIDNGWLNENQFYFVYQYETILDFSELIYNAFCHADSAISWDELSIGSLTRESSASIIYENGYVYYRTMIDVELGGIPNLLISCDDFSETIDHTDHTHPEPTHVYNNIVWDNNGDGDGNEPNPDEGDGNEPNPDEGDGNEPNPDEGGDNEPNPDEGDGNEPNPDEGDGNEPNPDEGGGEIKPDDKENVPFNSSWCELGYDIYVERCEESSLEPCSYDYWIGRANIVVDTYARAYAEYKADGNEDFTLMYENFVTNANGQSDGWALVMLYQMYRAEYVAYDYQPVDENSPWIRPFDGLTYDAWLELLPEENGQAVYDLYVDYSEENNQHFISYDTFINNSKNTYNELAIAMSEDIIPGEGDGDEPNPDEGKEDGGNKDDGDFTGDFVMDKFEWENFSNLFNPDFWEALFTGNVKWGDGPGCSGCGSAMQAIMIVGLLLFIFALFYAAIKIIRVIKTASTEHKVNEIHKNTKNKAGNKKPAKKKTTKKKSAKKKK